MDNYNFEILSTNDIGNVLYCKECNDMMIGIGTFILKFKENQARLFLKALLVTQSEYGIKRNQSVDKIFLKTPVNNMLMALNEKELGDSINLIEFAFLKLEIEALISL